MGGYDESSYIPGSGKGKDVEVKKRGGWGNVDNIHE